MAKKPPAQRKGWTQLSPEYRKRLQRNGITAKSYRSGAPLHKARGKISPQHENTQRQFWRIIDRSPLLDRDDAQEVIDNIGFQEANEILTYREMAIKGDNPLAAGAMKTLFGIYDGIVPKEWLYYGGKSYK